MTVAVVGIALAVLVSAYMALNASEMAAREAKLIKDFVVNVDDRLSIIENDIKRLKVAMEDNENSHGVLSLMIQEISATEKIGELRKEVLRMKEETR